MKTLLLFIAILMLGCGEIDISSTSKCKVVSIQKRNEGVLCDYRLHFNLFFYINLADTCGKYNVGDVFEVRKIAIGDTIK